MLRLFGVCQWSRWIFFGAMYAIDGESKMMALSGSIESCHPPAISFRHSKVVGASTREVRIQLLLFEVTDIGRDAA